MFEGLAEVSECEMLSETCEEVHTEDDECEAHFEYSGLTFSDISHLPEAITPPITKIRDMESEEGKLLWDILQKVQDEKDVTEPIWGVDLVDSVLTPEQSKSYAMIIHQFADIFAKDDEDLGRTFWVKHAIDTGDAAPLRGQAYRSPLTLRKALEEMIAAMERQGVVKKIKQSMGISCSVG